MITVAKLEARAVQTVCVSSPEEPWATCSNIFSSSSPSGPESGIDVPAWSPELEVEALGVVLGACCCCWVMLSSMTGMSCSADLLFGR